MGLETLRKHGVTSHLHYGKSGVRASNLLSQIEPLENKMVITSTLDEIKHMIRGGELDASPNKYVETIRKLINHGLLDEAEAYLLHAYETPLKNSKTLTSRTLNSLSVERGAISIAKRMAQLDTYVKSIIYYINSRTNNHRKKRFAVVSVIAGNYDKPLLPQCVEIEIDYILFTDQKLEDYGFLEIRPLPYTNIDRTRAARYVKTNLTKLIKGYDAIAWVDGNIMLNAPLAPMMMDFIRSKHDFMVMMHPFRSSLHEEIRACMIAGKDAIPTIQRQRDFYHLQGYRSENLIESNVFFANPRSTVVTEFFEIWWEQIKTFSRRDQLSINYCLDKSNVNWGKILPYGMSARNHPNFVIFEHGKEPDGYKVFASELLRKLKQYPQHS